MTGGRGGGGTREAYKLGLCLGLWLVIQSVRDSVSIYPSYTLTFNSGPCQYRVHYTYRELHSQNTESSCK